MIMIIIAKREGNARGHAAAPVVLVLWWLWNGIKMRIARLERVRRNERGAAAPAILRLIEDSDHDHGGVKGARGVVANLNVGVEERHVAEPLAERDALVDDADYVCVRALLLQPHTLCDCRSAHLAAVSVSHSYCVWKKNEAP
jgi:hypothetical protein